MNAGCGSSLAPSNLRQLVRNADAGDTPDRGINARLRFGICTRAEESRKPRGGRRNRGQASGTQTGHVKGHLQRAVAPEYSFSGVIPFETYQGTFK